MKSDLRAEALHRLRDLLREYDAELYVEDRWRGWPEGGEDLHIIMAFNNTPLGDYTFGEFLDPWSEVRDA